MSSKELHQDIGFHQEKKRTIRDISQLDPMFGEVIETYPFVKEGLGRLQERSPWKFDHTIRTGQVGLYVARLEFAPVEDQRTLTVSAMLHDVSMVDDDMVDLTNSTVSLEGDTLHFLVTEHPRRAAELYAEDHPDASLLIGAHSVSPGEAALPVHLRNLHRYLYLADQVDARMSNRPYRSDDKTQTASEVIADLLDEYPQILLEAATDYHKSIHTNTPSLPQAA